MNKSIMMPIQPKWLVKILNGDKTIEIRKIMPKCKLPIDVYIYCTQDRKYANLINRGGFLTGMVVAKFTLEKISPVVMQKGVDDGYGNNGFLGYALCGNCFDWKVEEKACLTEDELFKYLNGIKRPLIIPKDYKCKRGYAWHISNLEIFDKPKELGEFHYYKKRLIDCGMDCPPYFDEVKTQVRKAPQSWQYIYIEEII